MGKYRGRIRELRIGQIKTRKGWMLYGYTNSQGWYLAHYSIEMGVEFDWRPPVKHAEGWLYFTEEGEVARVMLESGLTDSVHVDVGCMKGCPCRDTDWSWPVDQAMRKAWPPHKGAYG